MKPFIKMSKTEVVLFCLMAICSGLMIGVGATACLLANSLFGDWGRLIGGILFSIGIYAIVVYEMRLFTGMVASIPKLGLKNSWQLVVCFIGNVIGVAIIAGLVYFTPIASIIIPRAQSTILAKLSMNNWQMSSLCSSILCGSLITLSVWSVRYAPKKSVSATLGVIFPIVVFAFCGFDHSVANMFYFICLGEISWRVVGYCLLSILGNIFGGIILPCISLLKEKTQKENTTKQ